MMQLLALGVALIGQTASVEGEGQLIEYLRDAQVSNASHFRTGRMTVHVDLTNAGRAAHMEAEIEWAGEDALWKFRVDDPGDLFENGSQNGRPLNDKPWDYMMRKSDTLYMYSSMRNRLIIDRYRNFNISFLEWFPEHTWFSCCSPLVGHLAMRPWVEMVGPHPAFPHPPGTRFRITQEGGGIIRHVREDTDGSVLETDFSTLFCGNAVRHTYKSKSRTIPSTWSQYRWRKDPEGICALTQWDYQQGLVADPRDATYRLRLVVDSVDRRSVPPSRFTMKTLSAHLPGKVVLQDRIRNISSLINPDVPLSDEILNQLSDVVRQKGFARPE